MVACRLISFEIQFAINQQAHIWKYFVSLISCKKNDTKKEKKPGSSKADLGRFSVLHSQQKKSSPLGQRLLFILSIFINMHFFFDKKKCFPFNSLQTDFIVYLYTQTSDDVTLTSAIGLIQLVAQLFPTVLLAW